MTWEQAWSEDRTPWDAGAPAPELVRLLEEGVLSGKGRALVTGCGRGWDAFALAAAGYETTGLDIAESAGCKFAESREEKGVHARIAIADFFTWQPAMRFDVIWDYTFLCALHPSERHRWLDRVDALLAPGGTLATLIFPMIEPAADYQGPPWPLHPGHLESLTAGRFEASHLGPAQKSHAPRVGKEWLGLWTRPST